MRLAVTGGGTGGHIYPALEVARHSRSSGDEVLYFGSYRGQEGEASKLEGLPFSGVEAQPLLSMRTLKGLKSAVAMLRAVGRAKAIVGRERPDVLFSTGGYSAAPYLHAARSLKIPFVIFEANSIPGRTHRMFAPRASAFASVFHKTAEAMPATNVTRTGMPIRKSLREAAGHPQPARLVLVVGGSQGSAFLNQSVPKAVDRLEDLDFVIAVGKKNPVPPDQGRIRYVSYLEQEPLIEAYRRCCIVIGRSGGSLAELALFRLPSVLIPLPTSADAHQLHNAREFEAMGAATVLKQSEATPEAIAAAVKAQMTADASSAKQNLAAWDLPDATERIYDLILKATA